MFAKLTSAGVLLGGTLLIMVVSFTCLGGRTEQTWHNRFSWSAEDYFEDPKVIALCRAIEANDLDEMEQLIQAGADVNAKGMGNMTPLLWAFPDNKPERFAKLLEHGADPNVVVTSDFNTKMSGILPGDSVTHMVCRSAFTEHFRLAFAYGADANQTSGTRFRDTPLFAVIKGNGEDKAFRIDTLINRKADLNVHNGANITPAMQAVSWGGQYDIALQLLCAGADPTVRRQNHASRLIHTVVGEDDRLKTLADEDQQQYTRLIEWLLAHGESSEKAKLDLQRWRSWIKYPRTTRQRLLQAEIAELEKARERRTDAHESKR